MNNLGHWYAMGGYGVYIWSAYGFVLMGLFLCVLRAKRQGNLVRHRLKQWFNRIN